MTVLDLQEIDETQVALVGGKGAHLGALSHVDGVRVPPGFCVTTDAFQQIMASVPSIEARIGALSEVDPDDRDTLRRLSAEIRRTIEEAPIPGALAAAITDGLVRHGAGEAFAVRSSATAEDLPTASFAGQQDTYLNVVGPAEVLRHVSRCWASLFTERAVTYRRRNGIDHRVVRMAVVVQRMVAPDAAGILFTADPVSGDRTVTSVDAGFGLGEALVSGLVNADTYRVRDGVIIDRVIGVKRLAIHALPGGGTEEREIDPARQEQPALTDAQVVALAALGRRIEAHFGRPQDIEWCLVAGSASAHGEPASEPDAASTHSPAGGEPASASAYGPAGGEFQIVQSRPITTLFPVPEREDGENRVYLSVGHQQMMTDAMTPLGLSVWQLTAMAAMLTAGGRLFVDSTPLLAVPANRAGFLAMVGRSDPLTRDALETVLARDFVRSLPDTSPPPAGWHASKRPAATPIATDAGLVTELIAGAEASLAALDRDIREHTGPALFDFLRESFEEHKRVLSDPRSMQVIMAGMEATWWLNDTLHEWLGETNAADALSLSAPGNITSEMGLALLDVADVIRPHPELVSFLRGVSGDDFLDDLGKLPGGAEARDAIEAYLDRYGMRCAVEIDITRPRWRERPATLLPAILDNVRNFGPGEAAARFARGLAEARAKEEDVLTRLRALPDGEAKAAEAKAMIDRVRTFIGYREYPKYNIICRFFVYKRALLEEVARLVRAGVLVTPEDAFYLTFAELEAVVRTREADASLIAARRDEFRRHQALKPPRVLTSDGEMISGAYRRDDLPPGALPGLAVSAGIVEGRARVILDLADADLEPGDILVTAYTDPSWSPLFVGIAALVTEIGGLMTHGAVIAREYGLPAVIGVPGATHLIRDGQRIRVHGTHGYVELLDAE